ncbi:PREDICTED: uncharacterized protein LOC104817809 [Tarenaya hassleriana]|uniref:uncharacterized protein LOC104817809 n=1 Tax=Tarenaya hassleriana TaxID=28532 RepID=UPI00053C6118|nr:PREDICTED: uncharacterized protein LOC104817809 [Tarenaya hassleriana]
MCDLKDRFLSRRRRASAMAFTVSSHRYTTAALALTVFAVSVSVSVVVSRFRWRRRHRNLESRISDLEKSLDSITEKCASERRGRVRAQQELREALAQNQPHNLNNASYPMRPIGTIQSCFSTRNGTPRQPLLVSLARACLTFDPALVPPASLEGLGEYSYCWVIYVFHLNTDIEKLWRKPSQSKLKAKVRVPRLKGGRMGLFATRSPHRPCPIGLTVAKVEAIQGHMMLLSGVDLVDGTPVLDIKPYLPYSDSIEGARVPEWVKEDSSLAVASVSFSDTFSSSIANCWKVIEKNSLYASIDEFKSLIEQVLSWDIRSVSQRIKPQFPENGTDNFASGRDGDVVYHLALEGLDVSYSIDSDSNIVVEDVSVPNNLGDGKRREGCISYNKWRPHL